MRIAVEYIYDSQKVLVRLLTVPADTVLLTPESPVQVGTYIIEAFPQLQQAVSFDIEDEQIVEGEAKVYLSGWYDLPDQVKVTLPDLTVQEVLLKQVKQPPKEPITIEQPLETITPRPSRIEYPAHAGFKPDEMADPELPPFWFEFNAARSEAFKPGIGMTSDIIVYNGGVAGRALDTKILQEAANYPPFKQGAPTRLEGSFTNNLPNSDFLTTSVPPGFFDPFPAGWGLTLNDMDNNWIRTQVNFDTTIKLPHVRVVWYQRPDYVEMSSQPPVTITSTAVPFFHTFQVLVVPDTKNSAGTIQLKSATNLAASPVMSLATPVVLKLNVGSDGGPVKILWNQTTPESNEQVITLYAAMSTQYPTPHSYVPEGATSAADLLSAANIGGKKWYFSEGYIRLDSEQELLAEPLSWTLNFSSGPVFLKVEGGMLSSDFSSSAPVTLAAYLPTDLTVTGNYKLKWRWGEPMRICTRLPDAPEQEVVLPFVLDIPILDSLLTSTMDISFQSYTSLAGSSRIKYFVFKAKEKPQ